MHPDLSAALERALDEKVRFKQGEKERMMTKAEMGIAQLVNQFAKGDRHARRDLVDLAGKLGVDLIRGQPQAVETAFSATHEQILESYIARRTGASSASTPVFAPPDLLDDDDVDEH
jgi:hypothetical protein